MNLLRKEVRNNVRNELNEFIKAIRENERLKAENASMNEEIRDIRNTLEKLKERISELEKGK